MNQASTFYCPSCSAPLGAPVEGTTVRCPYCGNTIIPPESLASPRAGVEAQQVNITTSAATIDFQEYRELLAQGEKIEAIRRLRKATGLGLKQSKEIIEALERGEDMRALAALLGDILPHQQAAEAMQAINLEGQSISPASAKRAVKVAGASLTCGLLALIGFILLATVVPVFFALTVGGGPLAPLWNTVDPLSPVGVELRFGEDGIGAGQFDDPRAIAADDAGDIYVADYTSGRVQSFDSEGNFRWLANLGEESYIQAMDVARDGALLVVARGALRRFDPADGAELPRLPLDEEYYFEDVAVAPDGRIAAIVDSEGILVLDRNYQPLLEVPQAVSTASGDSELEANIDIDGLGNLYVLGSLNNSIFTFSPRGRFTNRIASQGDAKGQLSAPGDLAIDGQGRIYVSDFNGVQIFDGDGRYLDKFDLGGYIFGLNFDLQDKLYTVSNDPEVMRLQLER